MWREFFKLKGFRPGILIFPAPYGEIDFSRDHLDINVLKKIVEDDRNFPHLQFTKEGEDHFYDDEPDDDNQTDIKGNDHSDTEVLEVSLFGAKELVKLIKESTDEEKVRYYYGLGKQYSSVEKAYNKKIIELGESS